MNAPETTDAGGAPAGGESTRSAGSAGRAVAKLGPACPAWYWWTLLGLTLAAAAVMPFDAPVARAMAELREGTGGVRLGGDVRRELEALQQFGQLERWQSG
jgi:hypothetical protein